MAQHPALPGQRYRYHVTIYNVNRLVASSAMDIVAREYYSLNVKGFFAESLAFCGVDIFLHACHIQS